MKSVFCEPVVNEAYDPVRQCKQYEAEIQFLKNELAMHDTLTNRSQVVYEPLSEAQRKELKQQIDSYLAKEITEIDIVNVRQIKEMLEMFRDIVNTMEYETEKRLREKYIFQEKTATSNNQETRGKLKSKRAEIIDVQEAFVSMWRCGHTTLHCKSYVLMS